MILAIDPGMDQSGWVLAAPLSRTKPIERHGIIPNGEMIRRLLGSDSEWGLTGGTISSVVIEEFEARGNRTGQDSIITVRWAGRMEQAVYCNDLLVCLPTLITRRKVLRELTGTNSGNDAAVKQALIDRYGPGNEKAIGLKKTPGPLYGIKAHEWAAFALAVVLADGLGS